MKAILKFDLNEPDDRTGFKQCSKASDMACVIWEFVYNSKKGIEHSMDGKEMDKYEAMELVFEKFHELLESYNVNIDDLE